MNEHVSDKVIREKIHQVDDNIVLLKVVSGTTFEKMKNRNREALQKVEDKIPKKEPLEIRDMLDVNPNMHYGGVLE